MSAAGNDAGAANAYTTTTTSPRKSKTTTWASQRDTPADEDNDAAVAAAAATTTAAALSNLQQPSFSKIRDVYRGHRIAKSDGFLDSSSPAAGRGSTDIPSRLTMMRAAANANHLKTKRTNESSWKIYQQLKVGKQ